jgi:S-adenosylmethionine/arginine decarboxylase-like enzyme
MQTQGQHLLLDLWLAEDIETTKVDRLFELVRTRFSVVNEVVKDFEPFGTTAVFILSESHFTLHTYPEHAYMSVDLYVCNFEVDLSAFAEEVKSLFRLHEAKGTVFLRGVPGSGAAHRTAYKSSYPAARMEELAAT